MLGGARLGIAKRGCSDGEDVELGISSEGLEESRQGGVGVGRRSSEREAREREREQHLLSFHR